MPGHLQPTRAPLLWLLVPLLLGYLGAHHLRLPPLPTATLAALLALAAALLAWRLPKALGLWTLVTMLAATLAAATYCHQRHPHAPLPENLPPRQASLTLRIDRLFDTNDHYGRLSGIATIVATPPHLTHYQDLRTSFHLLPRHGETHLLRGQYVSSIGELLPVPAAPPPDSFEHYLHSQRIPLRYQRGYVLETVRPAPASVRFYHRLATRMEQLLRAGTPSTQPALTDIYIAMTLGKKSAMPDNQRATFLHSGTLHLFAISGLHIGIVAALLFGLLHLLRLPPALGPWVGLPLVYLYVQITGASPSAIRAWLMVLTLWGARACLRQPAAPAALVASAFLVLLWAPTQLWSAGFQLSYFVVAMLLLYGVPLARFLQHSLASRPLNVPDTARTRTEQALRRARYWLLGSLAISLAATLGSTPLLLAHFGLFTPLAIVPNLVLVPLAALVLTTAMLATGLGVLFGEQASACLNPAATLIIQVMDMAAAGYAPTSLAATFTHPWQAPLLCLLLLLTCVPLHRPPPHSPGLLRLLMPPLTLVLALPLLLQRT